MCFEKIIELQQFSEVSIPCGQKTEWSPSSFQDMPQLDAHCWYFIAGRDMKLASAVPFGSMIDPDGVDPESQAKKLFIHWTTMCNIIGKCMLMKKMCTCE